MKVEFLDKEQLRQGFQKSVELQTYKRRVMVNMELENKIMRDRLEI